MTSRNGLKRLVRQRVVVHTRDERSIRGVLLEIYRDCVVLAEPEYLQEAKPAELKGNAVIPTENVAWLQILGGGA